MHDLAVTALIGELRDQLAILEARIADLEAQAMQDRRQLYPIMAHLQELQRQHNLAAARALAEETA